MSHRLISQIAFTFESSLLDAEARQLRPATLHYYRHQLTRFLVYAEQHGVHEPRALAALSSGCTSRVCRLAAGLLPVCRVPRAPLATS